MAKRELQVLLQTRPDYDEPNPPAWWPREAPGDGSGDGLCWVAIDPETGGWQASTGDPWSLAFRSKSGSLAEVADYVDDTIREWNDNNAVAFDDGAIKVPARTYVFMTMMRFEQVTKKHEKKPMRAGALRSPDEVATKKPKKIKAKKGKR